MFYTDIKTNSVDKWTVMKILQSKGIISFDEDNYHSMDCRLYNDGSTYNVNGFNHNNSSKWPTTHIMIVFSGYTKEFITIDEYNTFKRNITIDKVLESN